MRVFPPCNQGEDFLHSGIKWGFLHPIIRVNPVIRVRIFYTLEYSEGFYTLLIRVRVSSTPETSQVLSAWNIVSVFTPHNQWVFLHLFITVRTFYNLESSGRLYIMESSAWLYYSNDNEKWSSVFNGFCNFKSGAFFNLILIELFSDEFLYLTSVVSLHRDYENRLGTRFTLWASKNKFWMVHYLTYAQCDIHLVILLISTPTWRRTIFSSVLIQETIWLHNFWLKRRMAKYHSRQIKKWNMA